MGIMGNGIILLFVSIAYVPGGSIPVVGNSTIVDPIPHTVMLTLIVVNLATTALGLALVFHLYGEYGTLDTKEMMESDDLEGGGSC